MIYIFHHLGLGDHIICNGMVRYFYKKNGSVRLFCYKHNKKNVDYMYRDLEHFETIPVDNVKDADDIFNQLNNSILKIKIGFDKLHQVMDPLTFDESFYKIAEVDFSIRFDEFFLKRDLELEKKILKKVNPEDEKYVFVHDDSSRGFEIDKNRIQSPHKKIYNDNSIPFFNCLGLIENAEEVHVMQSSFKDLINSFKFNKPKFYLHEYVRNYSHLLDSKGHNKFINLK